MAVASRNDGRPRRANRIAHDSTVAASFASTAAVRRKMQAQRSRDTAPELELRRAVHSLGMRYRVDRAPLKGFRRRADLVFGPVKLAVFVDGCFWHACPEHGNWPQKNQVWWRAKLEHNRQRDRATDERLREAGWTVLRVWEHEDAAEAAARISSVVSQLRSRRRAANAEANG